MSWLKGMEKKSMQEKVDMKQEAKWLRGRP